VSADARGPLAELLGVVNTSPLAGLTGRALANASASGNADYRFKLAFPIAAVERIAVQGTIALAGNDLQISADTPRLARARGSIAFTENGFSVAGVQARALGGDVRIEGGLNVSGAPTRAPVLLRLQGTASAEGLRQARELGFVARLAQYGSGSSAYTATLGLRAKVPELLVSSTLVGMALNLPAPFAKAAETPLPLRLETKALGANAGRGAAAAALDQWQLDLGERVSVLYVRDISGAEARVVRGAIAIGLADDESAPLPEQGVVASVNTASVDVDAWSQVLAQGSDSGINASSTASTSASSSASSTVRAAGNAAAMGYLPTSLVVRAQELSFGGRKLNHVLLGGSRDGLLWRGNLDAEELNGYVEYRQSLGPTAGRFYARLARLAIGHGTAQDVENLLDEQPASIPALDIVVDDFELRGKKLGHLDIEAVNVGAGAARDASREWRLNRFNIVVPEATLTATGNWTNIVSLTEPTPRRSIRERRRTAMKFKLDIADAGALLERFGMAGVVRRGKGTLEGRVGWLGSPITLDYPSLGGDMKVAVETGQFLKTDPGVAKLLGVLSLQSLPRRLMLDFRDVFSEGFAFDYLRGDVTMEQGIARTNNLQMKGVSAAVLMEGSADIAKETQNIKVLVVPEINAGSASLIASTINPLVGLTSFLAQLILRQPLIEATTQEYLVDGSWLDPHVTQVERRSAAPAGAASTPKEKAP
ncbi:MAG: YhdP family phospholipid transporter, partial [Rhodoferax sp.]